MICYDYINEYIRNTIKEDQGVLLELRKFAALNNIPVIQPETARLLLVLGLIIKPRKILEIGTAIGYSSILLAGTLSPGGVVDTIESYGEMVEMARYNIKRAGCQDKINSIAGDAAEVLRCLDKRYDLILLDAAKGQYLELLPDCIRLLSIRGVLISDNVLYKGMVANDRLIIRRKKTIVKRLREYLKCICNKSDVETCILPVGDGVAVTVKLRDNGDE
ncbi:MAG: O-methyltransferase [Firmicutes bacterium]|nr:O-methyltransferase [Bacillota bacterium]